MSKHNIEIFYAVGDEETDKIYVDDVLIYDANTYNDDIDIAKECTIRLFEMLKLEYDLKEYY